MLAAATFEEGPLALEGQHAVLLDGTETLVLNNPDVWPRYRLDRVTGMRSLPDADDLREARRGNIGERIFKSTSRGKTVTFEGRVMGRTLPEMRAAATAMTGTFAERSKEMEWRSRPHPGRGGIEWVWEARVLACDIDDTQDYGPSRLPTPWQRRFVLSVRQSDPRYYVESPTEATGIADTTNARLDNFATAPSEPVFTLHGPFSETVTLHKTVPYDRTLELQSAVMPTLGSMTLDFREKSIVDQDGRDRSGFITMASDWWNDGVLGIHPGTNYVRVDGVTTWDLWFRSASW